MLGQQVKYEDNTRCQKNVNGQVSQPPQMNPGGEHHPEDDDTYYRIQTGNILYQMPDLMGQIKV